MTRDEAIAAALADIRAIPTPEPQNQASACCAGDRAGYLRHRWHGEEPCAASRAANRDYGRAYRAANPGYFRAYRRRRAAQPPTDPDRPAGP